MEYILHECIGIYKHGSSFLCTYEHLLDTSIEACTVVKLVQRKLEAFDKSGQVGL